MGCVNLLNMIKFWINNLFTKSLCISAFKCIIFGMNRTGRWKNMTIKIVLGIKTKHKNSILDINRKLIP